MAVTKKQRVLVAVSGGPDSMALLHLFLRWSKEQVGVFHLNHGFRETAKGDAEFVASYAREHGIPVEIASFDVNNYLKESGESKQQGARTIRYQLMEAYAKEHGFDRIALAHHGDDQAETVLMRIVRGSGLHGLSGIPPKRGPFIRPLLAVSKDDILKYCQEYSVPYVEDETNFQPVYLRNKVRQELLPLLRTEYNPEIARQLVQLAELARDDELVLQARADQIAKEHSTWRQGQLLFPRERFQELAVALQRRLLRALIREYQGHLLQIDFEHIETWRKALLESTSFRLPLPSVWVGASRDVLFLGEYQAESWSAFNLTIPGKVRVAQFTIEAELWQRDNLPLRPPDSEDFDLDALILPLRVRPRQDGDRFSPFGLAGSKKIKDLLIDAHIPLAERDFLPLVVDQKEILWVPGVRRGAAAPLRTGTKQVVRLRFKTNQL